MEIGYRIAERYEIHRILGGEGKSGMGIVYVCYDHEHKEVLALKTFQDKYLNSKQKKDDFKKEALAWIQLERHPYIVRALWVQELDYRMFIASEFIAPDEQKRNTLTHYLSSPISLKQALTWSIQFCYGMEYACSRGVTPHRDIKPDNLMITKDGTLKITDFGLAGLWEGADAGGLLPDGIDENRKGLTFCKGVGDKVVAGTPSWMAPEQFEGKADVRSDIYSFGIVMYQMINGGRCPFTADNPEHFKEALCHLHRTAPVPKINSLLFPIVECCLAKDPQKRYQSFSELQGDLSRLLKKRTGETITPPEKKELDATEHLNKGFSFTNLGLIDEAIAEYREALRINSKDVEAHNNLGNALYSKGFINEAIAEWREALRINPEFAGAHNGLGNALQKKGHIDEAIEEYREALRINPGDAKTHYNLGNTFYNKDLIDEAIEEYREALRINPGLAEAHCNLGNRLNNKGLIDEAIEEYREALRINPEDAETHNNLAGIYYIIGFIDEAIAEYREALRINPRYAEAHFGLGNTIREKGLIDDAILAYENFIKYAPPQYASHVKEVKGVIVKLKSQRLYYNLIKINKSHSRQ